MFRNSKTTFYLGLLLFVSGLFYSCAQIGSISGGLKDTIPPVMIYSEPVLADTGFVGHKVKITFDEYFEMKEMNEEFISSPPLKNFPKFTWKKHTLIVDFKEDTLIKPVTYVFDFGNAIVDLNEGNIVENFRFVFSTGSVVDSFSISGRIKNAFDLLPPEKALIMVYHDHSDSIPYLSVPDYLCKTDSGGNFSIDFIKEGTYKIFALQDLNGNLMFDPMEHLAFLDSIIVPQREVITYVDSVKAGTILHDINNPEYADSLINDTVIITEKNITWPDNIFLYMFAEKNKKQYLSEYIREKRGKINLKFDIPVTEEYQFRPLNFTVSDDDYLLELNPEKDSLLYWYKDTLVQAIDTLEFELKFASIDSLSNPIIETDTVYIEYREKKKKGAWKKKDKEEGDTIKKIEYLNFEFNLENKQLDLKKNLGFELDVPLLEHDTSLIKLFTIQDTSTVDTKEQKIIRAIRISENSLFIEFKRPTIKPLVFRALGFDMQNAYTLTNRVDSSTFYYQITDEELVKTDTLKLIVNYDNNFFLGQIQDLSDTIILAVEKQRLKAKKRDKDNIIELGFNKPFTNPVDLSVIGFDKDKNALDIRKNSLGDSLKITIKNNRLRLTDTLKLYLKSLDYTDLAGKNIFYTDTITMVYHEKEQYLSSVERFGEGTFTLIFNKPLTSNVIFEPQNFTADKQWFTYDKNTLGDTLVYTIINDLIAKKDTLDLIVSYQDKDRKNQTYDYRDTLKIIRRKAITIKEKVQKETVAPSIAKTSVVHIYVPLEYELQQDSLLIRNYYVLADWQEDTKYRFTVDSMAFIDYFNHYNQFNQYEFSTRKMDYYSLINLKISKLKPDFSEPLIDSVETDSVALDSVVEIVPDSLQKGQVSQFIIDKVSEIVGDGGFILQVINEEGEVFKEYFLDEDIELKIDYINPGTYQLKLIFDRNGNGKWDTGNYLKKIQPEKVLIFPKPLEMKEGLEINMEWNISKQLLKSMKEGDFE